MGKNFNLYAHITDKIINALENGSFEKMWKKPWFSMPFKNFVGNHAYKGVNLLLLWTAMLENNWIFPYFLTLKQAKSIGAYVDMNVRTMVVFWNIIKKKKTNKNEEETFPVLRYYTVFNIAQCKTLPEKYQDLINETPIDDGEQNAEAEALIDKFSSKINHCGVGRAFYSNATDSISLPPRVSFDSNSAYYSTAFHELGHMTGHESRLNRRFGKRFGDQAYAFEELIAELSSAFLCGKLNVLGQLQHTEYIANWIQVLQSDNKAIFTASSQAEKATNFLLE